jgi:hypothetical protein
MFDRNELLLMEEELLLELMEEAHPLDEPGDLFRTIPEIRQFVDQDRDDEELGMRSILERPEALSKAWWHSAHEKRHRHGSKRPKRHAEVLRAA